MVRKYEVVLVIDSDRDEAGVREIVERVSTIIKTNGAEVEREDQWGRRQLAYPINKKEFATYVVLIVAGEGSLVGELNRQLRIMDGVIRYLVVEKDKYAPDFIPRQREEGRPERRGGERDRRDRYEGGGSDRGAGQSRDSDDSSASAGQAS